MTTTRRRTNRTAAHGPAALFDLPGGGPVRNGLRQGEIGPAEARTARAITEAINRHSLDPALDEAMIVSARAAARAVDLALVIHGDEMARHGQVHAIAVAVREHRAALACLGLDPSQRVSSTDAALADLLRDLARADEAPAPATA